MKLSPQPPEEPRWVRELDRRLKDLPERRAPETLAPRVMAALRARVALPWYRRTWWQWPPVAQVMSLLVFSALLGGLTWLFLHAVGGDFASSVGSQVAAAFGVLAPLWNLLATLAEALVLVLKQIPLLAWAGVALFLAVMYLSCIGLGTALYRIALPRRSP